MRDEAISLIKKEADRAVSKYGTFNSLHEAASVLREEYEEFWDEVKLKAENRNKSNMAVELVQIAAMRLKTLESFDLTRLHPECF